MSAWTIPRYWHGGSVAVLASGPSMSPAVADRLLRARGAGLDGAVVVNNTHQLAPWADILYAADAAWWQFHPEAMAFAGAKVSCEPVRGAVSLRNAGKTGYYDDATCVHTYSNSGAQAIQIAAKAGASRILLCGFDMHGTHWHGAHPHPLRNAEPDLMRRWSENMQVLATELARRDIAVMNCTPGSSLTCFLSVELEAALEACAMPHP